MIDSQLLAPSGVVVVESSSRNESSLQLELIDGLSVESVRRYGETTVAWLRPRLGHNESLGGDTE